MSNAQKTPLVKTLGGAATRSALNEIKKRGRSLPGTVVSVDGQIVTINFEVSGATIPQVTMPIYGAEYLRLPVQPKDLGAAFPVDVYMGGISGLGSGTATQTLQGNLSTLVWFPVGNKNWTPVDPNALTAYGPNGVVLRDTASHTVLTLTPSGIVVTSSSGSISMSAGGHTLVIDSTGVVIDGKTFLTHEHLPGTFTADGFPVVGDSGVVA